MTHFTEKYFDAFIYSNFWIDTSGEHLFFLKEIENKKLLHFLNLNETDKLSKAKLASTIDFNKQDFTPIKYFSDSLELFIISDTDNKEDYNLFKISIADQSFTKVTNLTYAMICDFSKNGKILIADRYKIENGISSTIIKIINLNKNETININDSTSTCTDIDPNSNSNTNSNTDPSKINSDLTPHDPINIISNQNSTITSPQRTDYNTISEATSNSNLNTFFNDIHNIISDEHSIYRITWGSPVFSTDEISVLITVDKEKNRKNLNILKINLQNKSSKLVLPESNESSNLWPLPIEFNKDSFLYVSDLSGYLNIYCHNFLNNSDTQLTDHKKINNGISVILNGNTIVLAMALVDLSKNITTLHFYELTENQNQILKHFEREFEGNVELFSKECKTIWIKSHTLSKPPCLSEYEIIHDDLFLKRQIELYATDKESLVHSTYKYLTYKSFDGLEIPAYLVLPKIDLKGVAIKAFYGGYNKYNYQSQIFAELGIATFSPAVRGSWGFGKQWEDSIKGDLGGNEILDLIWAAHFLENELNLPPSRIGLEGSSHGGYSVLRGLTMPENFNQQSSKYPFGFGICGAGFADLVDFYKTSNIPDWLVNFLGPYETNQKKYHDRSPINFFDELQSPLFIIHGTHDSRVSLTSMEGFIQKLKKSDKKYFVHLLEGQGHTSGSKQEQVLLYKNMFSFLDWHKFPK